MDTDYVTPHTPDFYIEALTACVTIFGDKAFKGWLTLNYGHLTCQQSHAQNPSN